MTIDIITPHAVQAGKAYRIDDHRRFLPRGTRTTTIEVVDTTAVTIRESQPTDLLTIVRLAGVRVLSSGVVS